MADSGDPSHRSLRQALGGLFDTGTALIRRGTVLGPLIPVVFLVVLACPVAAWLFRDVAVLSGIPVVSSLLLLGAASTVGYYLRQYSTFARADRDRLQSERYRLETRRMQYVMAKGLSAPAPPEALDGPAANPVIDRDEADADESDAPSLTETDR